MSPGATIHVPTKVMLAGEYALLRPGAVGLAMAVSPGFEVTCTPGADARLRLPDLGLDEPYRPGAPEGSAAAFVWAACRALQARAGQATALSVTACRLPGSLPVGASACLVAGTLLAGARALALQLSRQALLEAAVEAHRRAQGGGSGYDVATILSGGLARIESGPPGSAPDVRSRPALPGLRVVAAVTGEAAPTHAHVAAFQAAPAALVEEAAAAHAAASRELADLLFRGATLPRTAAAVSRADATLRTLDRVAGLHVFTPAVERLLAAAGPHPARVSGAGGGDLVVGFCDSDAGEADLLGRWRATGASTLPILPATPDYGLSR